ncbi:MAG: SDR family oxidoreductase [Litoreibacter sp.]
MTSVTHPDLSGQTAIITGASRGIGAATALHFGGLGAHVVLAARSTEDIKRLADDIVARGGTAQAVATDVSHNQAVADLVETTVKTAGRLDVLVNNAGLINPIARIMESDPDAWGQSIDVNIKGVYHGLRHAMPIMAAQGHGTIINISSGAANSFLEGWSHYCASKAGLQRLTGVAHQEGSAKGIRVVGLSPGTVATEMQEQIRDSGINPVSQLSWESHISPQWVARAIAYLTTPAADQWLGTDFSLKTDEGRSAIGMD